MITVAFFLSIWLLCTVSIAYAGDFFDFEAVDGTGNVVPLSKYKDAKAILVVNVASNCGFTYTNYRELLDIYDRLHPRGLEILAFPCNQFGEQEPGTNEEIQMFVKNYGLSFPVFAKIKVNGGDAHPLYKFLKSFTDNKEIGWNFVKFLVVNGYPVKKYHSRINPKKIEDDILPYLQPLTDEEDL